MNVSAASAVNSAALAQAARAPQQTQPPAKPETSHATGETSHNSKPAGTLDIKV
ncbi:hypothetical protein LRS10_23210 [Phenylobacterium sp. J426]|jgi:hypothetical protein|uniref:hypothetical protein n=1 Tax=Caulobacteraceae TaxID=76892 RepID=UPI000ADD3D01|nr:MULTISPECIES: hypothetical protein [Caulobacteraceae]MCR5876805.1 hypothetical protein [Phenylobacterium sp. J426]